MSITTTREPLVLGIESSCDETGIGIVRGTTLLANEVASSMDLHVRFGGVVPEIASRAPSGISLFLTSPSSSTGSRPLKVPSNRL